MRVTAVIPARYASSRFPGKPLAEIHGKPMIQWVYERTAQSQTVARVIVATDDERIAAAVRAFGGEVCMTRADHPTGTDRLAEVAAGLEDDLIVNVQGDEPLIDPMMIDEAVAPLLADPTAVMGTLMSRIDSVEDFLSPNVVKVVPDGKGNALYFSRAPVPFPRDYQDDLAAHFEKLTLYRHIGLYVYRRPFLLTFPTLPATPLERTEQLEQLRALEHGYGIKVALTARVSHGVDTPADLERVRRAAAELAGV